MKSIGSKLIEQGKKAFSFIDKKKDQTLNDISNHVEKGTSFVLKKMGLESKKKKYKYIAKVKLPNGKYRYFYKQSEYNNYLKRLEYQKTEPDFMKDVPDIDKNTVMNSKEDMAEINEKYDPRVLDYSMNCMNCTTAYELRKRGYDVEASANSEGVPLNELDKWFENPEYHQVDGDYIREGIQQVNSPNSRGNLMVYWHMGGGHSMAYETDDKGNISILDCQTNEYVDLDELSDYVDEAYIVRTDNLNLKRGVLDAVEEN